MFVTPMRFNDMGSNLPVDLPVPHTSTSQAGTHERAKGCGTTIQALNHRHELSTIVGQ